ncbi:AAA domain family protein [Candida albicans]|uniref:AAA domain family protein n=1 Tax=Candida albicans TaxID=5476 RepID=A0A8H6BVK5_CANAX|nr:AAA domain family protein [Candida albicans]
MVVVATLHGSGSYELKNSVGTNNNEGIVFDTIIIDEVSQSLEPQCWIPLLLSNRFKRLVIAGDNMQLPPTIKTQKSNSSSPSSSSSSASILATTLFDRLMKHCHGEKYKKLLDVQYRMNKSIMQFPSMQLYDNQLKCDDSVREISLVDLPGLNQR